MPTQTILQISAAGQPSCFHRIIVTQEKARKIRLVIMASAQKAEQIVRSLTRKYGFLNEKMMDDIEGFNAEYRREIDENWLAMESAVSHSVKM